MTEAARQVVSDPRRTLLDHAAAYSSAAQAHTVRLMCKYMRPIAWSASIRW